MSPRLAFSSASNPYQTRNQRWTQLSPNALRKVATNQAWHLRLVLKVVFVLFSPKGKSVDLVLQPRRKSAIPLKLPFRNCWVLTQREHIVQSELARMNCKYHMLNTCLQQKLREKDLLTLAPKTCVSLDLLALITAGCLHISGKLAHCLV